VLDAVSYYRSMGSPVNMTPEDDRRGSVRVYGCSPGCLLISIAVSVLLTILVNVLIRL